MAASLEALPLANEYLCPEQIIPSKYIVVAKFLSDSDQSFP